jgi:hypothetical protein
MRMETEEAVRNVAVEGGNKTRDVSHLLFIDVSRNKKCRSNE